MSIFGYLYRKIGVIICIGGIFLSLFLPLIFAKTTFGLGIIFFAFASYLGSSLIGYFINYKQILLSADQKNYVISAFFQTSGIIKTIIQIILALKYKNLYLWVIIEFAFSAATSILLNIKINKEYPWLKTNINNGQQLIKKYPEILINTKQVFIHQIKDFLLSKSDEIMVFAFVSLKMVAFYGNYTMIISKITIMVGTALDGVSAGVGNLVAENNIKNTIKVFWELISIRYYISGIVVFSLYQTLEPFITLWLGKEYLLDHNILILLLIYLYIMQTRGVIDMFNHSYGLYADTWSAWAEGIINITITIVAATKLGIVGILFGKIISIGCIIIIWKPYYLFTKGFKLKISTYWYNIIKHHLCFIISFTLIKFIAEQFPIHHENSYLQLFSQSIFTILPFSIIYFFMMLSITPGMINVLKRSSKIKKTLNIK